MAATADGVARRLYDEAWAGLPAPKLGGWERLPECMRDIWRVKASWVLVEEEPLW